MAWNGAAAGGAVGGALGGPAGAMAGAAIGGSNVLGLGDELVRGIKNPFLNNHDYRPYEVDPASFQNPYYEQNRQNYADQAAGSANRNNAAFWQQGGMDLASALAAQGNGQGPSLAQNQFNQAMQDSLAAQQAAAASAATAGNPALAQRTLAQQQAGMNQAAAGQSGILRLQEQMQARGMLASVLAQGGNMALQNQGLNDTREQFYTSLGYSADEANRQAQMERERLQAASYANAQANQYGRDAANQGAATNMTMGVLNAGSSLAGYLASDERQKLEVREPDGARIQSFLDSLDAKDFEYADPSIPGAAPGQRTGVMAQDVASTPVGRQMVVDSPTGLKLDPAQGLGAALAGLSQLNSRVKRVEGTEAPAAQPQAGRRILDAILKLGQTGQRNRTPGDATRREDVSNAAGST